MNKIENNIVYIMEAVNDLQDASDGSYLESLSNADLGDVNDYLSRLLGDSLTAKLIRILINHMLTDDPMAPNLISELSYETICDHTNDDERLADKISDMFFELSSDLVSDKTDEPTYL